MKRFHVHIAVENLNASLTFYSKLFGAEPSVLKVDYAKWMLDDPRINFAISQRAAAAGVDHLGFQVESSEELRGMEHQLRAADASLLVESDTVCCYARSDKRWVTDPQGVAWETFHTLGTSDTYNAAANDSACCTPNNSKSACC
jgi:hypothetical protein